MKRKSLIIMSLVLVLALCVGCLVACNKGLNTEQLDKLYQEFAKAHKNDAIDSPNSYWVEGSVFYLDDDLNEVTAKVKWTIEGTTLVTVGTETNAMGQYQIIVPEEVDQDVDYTLVGTLVNDDGKAYTDKDGKEYKLELTKKIGAGKAYKIAIRQLELGKVLYAKAEVAASYYMGSVETALAGADFYTENTDGGKKIYTMVGTTKSYLGAKLSSDGNHNNIVLGGIVNDSNAAAYTGSVWTITDDEIKTELNGKTLYLGTYSTKDTFSLSDRKTYPAFLVKAGTDVTIQAQVKVSEQNANCTVAFTSHTADSDNVVTVDIGTTVSFTVTPANGYEIAGVYNGSTPITAASGTYSVVVNAGVTIAVDARRIGAQGATSPVSCTISGSMPIGGWTYITNNENFPDPSFYSGAGLKMTFVGQGMTSPELDGATGNITVSLNIKALNAKQNALASNTHVFEIKGMDASGNVVATTYIDSATVGENNTATLEAGSAVIKTISIVMVEYPSNGTYACNVNLIGITISWG